MSEEIKVTETKTEETAVKTTKKSWFNRIWSAFTGLIVGVAAMFGVDQARITDIKEDVEEIGTKAEAVQVALQEKKYDEAIAGIKDVVTSAKEVASSVKEVKDEVQLKFNEYKSEYMKIKTAVESKNYTEAHNLAVSLAAKLTTEFPGDKLTGVPKAAYDLLNTFMKDLDEKKYDNLVELVTKIGKLFTEDKVDKVVDEAKAEVTTTVETVEKTVESTTIQD